MILVDHGFVIFAVNFFHNVSLLYVQWGHMPLYSLKRKPHTYAKSRCVVIKISNSWENNKKRVIIGLSQNCEEKI